eukprot:768761-Hanusia_phi.AAC.3
MESDMTSDNCTLSVPNQQVRPRITPNPFPNIVMEYWSRERMVDGVILLSSGGLVIERWCTTVDKSGGLICCPGR